MKKTVYILIVAVSDVFFNHHLTNRRSTPWFFDLNLSKSTRDRLIHVVQGRNNTCS